MIKKQKDYIPFGDEWVKEMMKWEKKELINLLRSIILKSKKGGKPEPEG